MSKFKKLQQMVQGRTFYRKANIQAKTLERTAEIRADTNDDSVATNNDSHTFVLISKDNATERYDWWEGEVYLEELDLDGADFSELRTFFIDHRPSVENAIGKVDNKRKENGELLSDVTYGSDDFSQLVKLKYDEGILTDVSIGYRIDEIVETKHKDQPNHVLVTKFTIVELSAVWKGADRGASLVKGEEEEQSESNDTETTEERFSLELYEKKQKLNNGRL